MIPNDVIREKWRLDPENITLGFEANKVIILIKVLLKKGAAHKTFAAL